MTTRIPWLNADSLEFPSIHTSLSEPDGLLAAGGDLSVERLTLAYQQGIFPWYEEDQPILWWSPDPRAVILPGQFRVSRSLQKVLRRNRFEVRRDTAFEAVIEVCSEPRGYTEGTWITTDMKAAYKELHRHGLAHSIECFLDSKLVGGLYGIAMGKLFFGESMFHHETDASKVAFAFLNRLLQQQDCPLIDCQLANAHLTSLGATSMPRIEFQRYLDLYACHPDPINWGKLPTLLSPWQRW
jgi:leucyl/phenylalanyl-tRNA---protein transferase